MPIRGVTVDAWCEDCDKHHRIAAMHLHDSEGDEFVSSNTFIDSSEVTADCVLSGSSRIALIDHTGESIGLSIEEYYKLVNNAIAQRAAAKVIA